MDDKPIQPDDPLPDVPFQVRCIDDNMATTRLDVGKVYTVNDVNNHTLHVIGDEFSTAWLKHRFTLLTFRDSISEAIKQRGANEA